MSVASNPLLFTAVLGSNAFTGTNIAETTLNAEPMMKTGSASNPTGTIHRLIGTLQSIQ